MGHPHVTIMPTQQASLGRWLHSRAKDDQRLKKLTEQLRKSAGKPMSREQRRKQMISWVYGQLPARMGISLEQVEEYLKDEL